MTTLEMSNDNFSGICNDDSWGDLKSDVESEDLSEYEFEGQLDLSGGVGGVGFHEVVGE